LPSSIPALRYVPNISPLAVPTAGTFHAPEIIGA
jgi:hypothetical protein